MYLLVIDDDPHLGSHLQSLLVPEYHLIQVQTGQLGLERLRHFTYDVTILDIDLPDLSGVSVCNMARQLGYTAPIVALSGWDSIRTRIELLNAGADDYVTKPFHPDEFKARLQALSRRFMLDTNQITTWQHLRLDLITNELHFPNHILQLPPKEAELLNELLRYPGRVISREILMEKVWCTDYFPSKNTLETHIKRLRQVLIDQPIDAEIQTIRGKGYRWQPLPDLRLLSQSPTMKL